HPGAKVVDNRGPGVVAAIREPGDVGKSHGRRVVRHQLSVLNRWPLTPRPAGRHRATHHEKLDKVGHQRIIGLPLRIWIRGKHLVGGYRQSRGRGSPGEAAAAAAMGRAWMVIAVDILRYRNVGPAND